MKVINNIIKALNVPGVEAALSKKLKGLPLSRNNFAPIIDKNSVPVYAVDGGSAVVCDGGAWLIAKIKIAVIGYNGRKKNFQEVFDYYATIINREDYEITIIDKDETEVKIVLPDFNAYEIDEVPAKIMKLLEWRACLELCRKNNLFIMMDSSLEPDNEIEKDLISEAGGTNNLIVGFCKTSRMRTTKGRSLLGVINALSPKNTGWAYHPLYEDEDLVKTFILKLNRIAKFCHKVQFFNLEAAQKALPVLAYYAGDSETIGYPYPLVKADKVARITHFERKNEANRFERELRKTELINDTISQSFHSELDKRMYRK